MLRSLLNFTQTLRSAFLCKFWESFDDAVTLDTVENDPMTYRVVSQMRRELPKRDSCAECHGYVIA